MQANMSEDDWNKALDTMNDLKMKKKGTTDDGKEIWSIG